MTWNVDRYLATYSLYGVPNMGVAHDVAALFLWPLMSLETSILSDGDAVARIKSVV
jgi:hypothetical protein